jgi:hypothetical protein
MNIKTRAELDEALRRVLVDAIADDPGTAEAEAPELVTVARSDAAPARLRSLRPPPRRPSRATPDDPR